MRQKIDPYCSPALKGYNVREAIFTNIHYDDRITY